MGYLERNYKVAERIEDEIKKHGSIENAIKILKAELNSYYDLWSDYSCDCLGHATTCTSLMIENLERRQLNSLKPINQ